MVDLVFMFGCGAVFSFASVTAKHYWGIVRRDMRHAKALREWREAVRNHEPLFTGEVTPTGTAVLRITTNREILAGAGK